MNGFHFDIHFIWWIFVEIDDQWIISLSVRQTATETEATVEELIRLHYNNIILLRSNVLSNWFASISILTQICIQQSEAFPVNTIAKNGVHVHYLFWFIVFFGGRWCVLLNCWFIHLFDFYSFMHSFAHLWL